jgi:VWFA-related protein
MSFQVRGTSWHQLAILLVLLSTAPPALSQAPTDDQKPPVFAEEVELVKVDVVVTDKSGNPATDLKQQDFTVYDEGKAQTITSFDVVQRPDASSTGASAARPARPRFATNAGPAESPGRSFVILFDNLHMTPGNAQTGKAAVATFLEKGVREGDRVSLVATGGGAWWSTRMEAGRPDLLAVLKGLDGRRILDNALERLTDYEAMRIYVHQDLDVARRAARRLDTYSSRSRTESQQMRDQLAERMVNPGAIDPYLESRATQTYLATRSRTRLSLGVIERALKPLAASNDRKALVLVSEGFVFDPSEETFDRVTEAARRANAAIYFVDVRGLQGLSSIYSAQFGAPIAERDLMSAIADTTQDGEGGHALAQDTGGFSVRNTNDLGSGMERIGRESRSYYLLSFVPANLTRDGRFHKIEVKLKGKGGLTVRARKGYFAPTEIAAAARPKTDKTDPEIQQALDSPFFLDGIPLRVTAYVLDENMTGRAQVLVAGEADVSRMQFRDADGRLEGALDMLIVVAHRDSGEFFRNDQKIDLQRKPGATPSGPAWYPIVREFSLAPGAYQAKLILRDASSRQIGTVAYEFEVPPLDAWRVSTPILTDAVRQPEGQTNIAPVLVARRTFRSGGPLYCRFDVYGAAKETGTGMPRVSAGHVLRRADGKVESQSTPTWISPTSIGAVSRMLQIPLDGAEPGEYELVLTVKDEIAGKTQDVIEPFTIAPSPSS